jgi:alkanesulfonate monooxygenase SsuD/methylene tetrahydromethanopterin reductase-like flavin-dependent oxidoreductase (luciferase family)
MPGDVILAAANAAQEHGYHSFWLNNPPGDDALGPLGEAAQTAAFIWLGVGIIPLSDRRPEEIVQGIRQNKVPQDRFYLGLGSGSGPGGVERVAEGVRAIRSELECQLVVAALGPRMCRLAGREADGVLLNWLTPEFARTAVEWVREGAEEAGKPTPRLMAYVRAALGDEATARLQREARSYEAIPHYAAHFKRMGAPAMDTAVTGSTPQKVQQGLAAWDGLVDEVVVRAVAAQDTVEDVMRILEAAKPMS